MNQPRDVLRQAMEDTGVSQTRLARLSGVRQPTISQILAGRTGVSDQQLARLLACLGLRLEVVRRAVPPDLTRSELRSWRLHQHLAARLSDEGLEAWHTRLTDNLERLAAGVRGEPHVANVQEWARLVVDRDELAMLQTMTGLDRHSIEMREVSPLGGLLDDDERRRVLQAS